MEKTLLTINEAADFLGKSTQTIRRLVKQRKIKYRRKRTPQGFNYFIEKNSLVPLSDTQLNEDQDTVTPDFNNESNGENSLPQNQITQNQTIHNQTNEAPLEEEEEMDDLQDIPLEGVVENVSVFSQPLQHNPQPHTQNHDRYEYISDFHNIFQGTFQELIKQQERVLNQMEEDKRNLYKLLESFQARTLFLEDRIRQLEAPKKKRWLGLF